MKRREFLGLFSASVVAPAMVVGTPAAVAATPTVPAIAIGTILLFEEFTSYAIDIRDQTHNINSSIRAIPNKTLVYKIKTERGWEKLDRGLIDGRENQRNGEVADGPEW